ncbi:MAG: hypothetical protein LBI69_04765 [Puniceicoccales bacterium]|nr:hypothetical protein [Puniceicoccales bacterium]
MNTVDHTSSGSFYSANFTGNCSQLEGQSGSNFTEPGPNSLGISPNIQSQPIQIASTIARGKSEFSVGAERANSCQ